LYAQGYSLADFLVQRGGKVRYLKFLEHAHHNGWDQAIKQHYKLHGVAKLESEWTGWITAGSPRLDLPKGEMLANAASTTEASRSPDKVIRSQSPDEPDKKPMVHVAGPSRFGRNQLKFPDFRQPVARLGSGDLSSHNEAWTGFDERDLPQPRKQPQSRPPRRRILERGVALPIPSPYSRNR